MKALEYIKKTPWQELNFVLLEQFLKEDNLEMTDELRDYLKFTPWNTNLNILKNFINNNSSGGSQWHTFFESFPQDSSFPYIINNGPEGYYYFSCTLNIDKYEYDIKEGDKIKVSFPSFDFNFEGDLEKGSNDFYSGNKVDIPAPTTFYELTLQQSTASINLDMFLSNSLNIPSNIIGQQVYFKVKVELYTKKNIWPDITDNIIYFGESYGYVPQLSKYKTAEELFNYFINNHTVEQTSESSQQWTGLETFTVINENYDSPPTTYENVIFFGFTYYDNAPDKFITQNIIDGDTYVQVTSSSISKIYEN